VLPWALTLLMLAGWLVPSGVSVPLCGCLFRGEAAQGCCQRPVKGCCSAGCEEPGPEPACPCSVEAPDQDPGTPPVLPELHIPAPAVLELVPASQSPRIGVHLARVEARARGPCRTVLRLWARRERVVAASV